MVAEYNYVDSGTRHADIDIHSIVWSSTDTYDSSTKGR